MKPTGVSATNKGLGYSSESQYSVGREIFKELFSRQGSMFDSNSLEGGGFLVRWSVER